MILIKNVISSIDTLLKILKNTAGIIFEIIDLIIFLIIIMLYQIKFFTVIYQYITTIASTILITIQTKKKITESNSDWCE